MATRRVTVGLDGEGRAAVVRDEVLEPQEGVRATSIYAADAPPATPNAGDPPTFTGPFLPGRGGLHVLRMSLSPGLGGRPLHRTDTVDSILQLSGESVFVLPDGEVRLKPGDWLVCNGVEHDWRNDGDEPAEMLAVIYGA